LQARSHEETIRRVCQEAVSNAIRHADPATITVAISASDSELCLRVSDDGRGIEKGSPRGMGLDNMRQRLSELGGKLRISSRRPHGTQVVAHLPRMDRHP
jgi:signal transduction histidine kinase